MRYVISILLVFACIGSLRAETGTLFFETLYDVPIMPGLAELTDQAVVFDKPNGRIAQVAAEVISDMSKRDVYQFYEVVLPQMGWKKKGSGVYAREGEKLTISVETQGQKQVFFFKVAPR